MDKSIAPETYKAVLASYGQWSFVLKECSERLELERNAAQEDLATIYRWIERNHPDGVIDSLSYLRNLERVTDRWYERLDKAERERDEAREELRIAVGLLSTQPQFADKHPEDVLAFVKEGGK
jgi:plasmid stabilization system protein ParE